MQTWTWSGPLTPQGTAPAPRAAHAAAAYQGRYMLLFGGGCWTGELMVLWLFRAVLQQCSPNPQPNPVPSDCPTMYR